MKKIKMMLHCDFTDQVMAEKRDELSMAIIVAHKTKEEKKKVDQQFKEQLDALYASATSLARQIRARGESKEVECLVKMHDPNEFEKTTIRLDTGEIVLTEPMTQEERQENLFPDEPVTLLREEPVDATAPER